jgi:type II secretory pathway pseudopilin PulG
MGLLNRSRRPFPPGRGPGEAGFTVTEILVALGVLSVGLVAILTSITFGATGIDGARMSTTALFLAEEGMEQVKARTLDPAAGWATVTAANFPAQAYGTIPAHPAYRRTFTITDNPGGVANTKQVEVRVFYRPTTMVGAGPETSVVVSTLLANR